MSMHVNDMSILSLSLMTILGVNMFTLNIQNLMS